MLIDNSQRNSIIVGIQNLTPGVYRRLDTNKLVWVVPSVKGPSYIDNRIGGCPTWMPLEPNSMNQSGVWDGVLSISNCGVPIICSGWGWSEKQYIRVGDTFDLVFPGTVK